MSRSLFALALALMFGLNANAQITIDFSHNSADTFYTTERLASIEASANYITSQLDGRGTVLVSLSSNANFGGPLAQAGTTYYVSPGSFSNGFVFGQSTTGSFSFSQHATGNWNTAVNWYTGTSTDVTAGQYDMQSVALHELSHAFGFASLIRSNGSGLGFQTPGNADTYSRYDSFLRVGSATGSPLLVNSSGQFDTTQLSGLTSNNLYFHGEFATAANGGTPVKLFAPTTYQPGSSISHLDSSTFPTSVMQPSITPATARRSYSNVELGMLIDMGWNQYFWNNNTTGTWGSNTASSTGSPWTNIEGEAAYSPVGTITTNMVLTFAGNGGYTSTNDLNLGTDNRFLVNRVILNASSGTSTIASNGTNVLRFGTTIGVTPLVRQDGAGAFNISHPVELTNAGLQLGGAGTGRVTLSGAISNQTGQTGGLTKIGSSTYALTGNNTYNGGTTVNAGTLLVSGQSVGQSGTGTGTVTVNGGTLGGTGRIGGAVDMQGGSLSPGESTGILTIDNNLSMASASTLLMEINGATVGSLYDQLAVNGTITLDNTLLTITGSYTPSASDFFVLMDNDGTDEISGIFKELSQGSSLNLNGANFMISYLGDASTSSFTGGNDVVLMFNPVPEPTTIVGLSMAGLVAYGLRRSRRKSDSR